MAYTDGNSLMRVALKGGAATTIAPVDGKLRGMTWPDDDTIDHPSSVAEHFSWLESAGFQAIELHWLVAGHAIFSARKL